MGEEIECGGCEDWTDDFNEGIAGRFSGSILYKSMAGIQEMYISGHALNVSLHLGQRAYMLSDRLYFFHSSVFFYYSSLPPTHSPLPTLSLLSRSHKPRPNVPHNNPQDPAIGQKEQHARAPQARREGTPAQKLELKALLQPEHLRRDPQCGGGQAQRGSREERGGGEVEGGEDQVPEEVLVCGCV